MNHGTQGVKRKACATWELTQRVSKIPPSTSRSSLIQTHTEQRGKTADNDCPVTVSSQARVQLLWSILALKLPCKHSKRLVKQTHSLPVYATL